MNADESFLGHCPECGGDIYEVCILVEYEKDDGTGACGLSVRRVRTL